MTDSIPIRRIAPGVSGLGEDAFTFGKMIKRAVERKALKAHGKGNPKGTNRGGGRRSRFTVEQRKAIVAEYLELRETDYHGAIGVVTKKYDISKRVLHNWRHNTIWGKWK